MSCTRCQRVNAAHRRYCGDCGTNLEPICRACGFENEPRDRYCGGCGCGMTQQAQPPVADIRVTPTRTMKIATSPPASNAAAAHELDGLFAAPAVTTGGPNLPDANISQDDLDRLFGAVP